MEVTGSGLHRRKGFDKNAVSWPTGGYALRETEEAASTGHFVACRGHQGGPVPALQLLCWWCQVRHLL